MALIALTPVDFFKLLSDDTRLQALLLIATEGELCVCELMAATRLSQPKISRHLAMLRKAGVLLDRRQGQWVFYRLNPALPAFASATLTSLHSHALLHPLQHQLQAMDSRPQRLQLCCPPQPTSK